MRDRPRGGPWTSPRWPEVPNVTLVTDPGDVVVVGQLGKRPGGIAVAHDEPRRRRAERLVALG